MQVSWQYTDSAGWKGFKILIFLCLLTAISQSADSSLSTCNNFEEFGWNLNETRTFLQSEVCTIDRIPINQLTQNTFENHYLDQRPVIIEGVASKAFTQLTTRKRLLEEYGDFNVILSTANTISHTKIKKNFREYIEQLSPHDPDAKGNETLYLFGPDSELGNAWAPLIAAYGRPPFAKGEIAYSFGVGGSGSGVPFHVHGHGFSECIHGSKRWLLTPPAMKPVFDPDSSSASWLRDIYPHLEGRQKAVLQECIIGPGDVLYFPAMWWHATVNIGEAVFMSSFVSSLTNKQTSTYAEPF